MKERYDCLDWINFVNCEFSDSKENIPPIYLAGISMGASTVLMASELELAPNVCGIMADCGYTSAGDIWKYVVKHNIHFPYDTHSRAIENMCKKKIELSSNECSTVSALEKCKVPVLFVHGTNDKFVPVEMTYKNYLACKSPKTLLIVPGATHATSYFVDKTKYESTMLDFWNKYDKFHYRKSDA